MWDRAALTPPIWVRVFPMPRVKLDPSKIAPWGIDSVTLAMSAKRCRVCDFRLAQALLAAEPETVRHPSCDRGARQSPARWADGVVA